METLTKAQSYLGVKFLCENIKKNKFVILQDTIYFKTFGKTFVGKDEMYKCYYDTPDQLFGKNGINISTNYIKKSATKELIVRYDSSIQRVAFLSYMPDTFKKTIGAKDDIKKHLEFLYNAILYILPKGLNCDIVEYLKKLQSIVEVQKKRERFKLFNNDGLRIILSFDYSKYLIPRTRKKVQLELLELTSESFDKKDEFNELARRLVVENPFLLKQQHSDLFVAKEYLLKEYNSGRLSKKQIDEIALLFLNNMGLIEEKKKEDPDDKK